MVLPSGVERRHSTSTRGLRARRPLRSPAKVVSAESGTIRFNAAFDAVFSDADIAIIRRGAENPVVSRDVQVLVVVPPQR